jgi:transcriptional regulator with XRE-family HTH domain
MTMHTWSQTELAKLAGLDISIVSHHLRGSRVIRDDHLAAYCHVLEAAEKERLVSAWLRDVLTAEDAAAVLEPHTFTLREDVRTWHPGLSEDQRRMLDWWAAKLAADDELDHIFKAISRKAGWEG